MLPTGGSALRKRRPRRITGAQSLAAKAARVPVLEAAFVESDEDVFLADTELRQPVDHGAVEVALLVYGILMDREHLDDHQVAAIDMALGRIEDDLASVAPPEAPKAVVWRNAGAVGKGSLQLDAYFPALLNKQRVRQINLDEGHGRSPDSSRGEPRRRGRKAVDGAARA